MPLELTFTAEAADIDELGHVNNAVWVRWVQEVATRNWEATAAPEHVEAYVWIVVRHEIDYLRALKLGETATARTSIPDPPNGAKFDRIVEFTAGGGNLLVKARSTWAILHKSTGRPLRVPPDVAARFL